MRRMTADEVVQQFEAARIAGDIYAHYQPQYNHATGRMIGCEALMRWRHPVFGAQYPNDFIGPLERSGLIREADLALFEHVCKFLRKRLDAKAPVVPVSFNVSHVDISRGDYVADLEAIRERYNIPCDLLRAELTETSSMNGLDLALKVMDRFHEAGYLVEMDDFGSGYSSLNVLKDLPFDIIKLDMRFLQGDLSGRGGTIINAMVQMAKWLETPTIAEGVETIEQADYMKSIGCTYVQGYLYARPMEPEAFEELLDTTGLEPTKPAMEFVDTLNANRFWSPDSLETLIFSNYVGAAAIFSYEKGDVEILRVNEKYLAEVGMNQTEQETLRTIGLSCLSDGERARYINHVEHAIATDEEETFETWRTVTSDCCGEDRICIRTTLRVIGRAVDQYIIYAIVQNVTIQRRHYDELADSERRFRFASEQANVYAWEYTIGTHEMRPCFRCMRDLGLPPLVRNYPEPAIELGIFPPDYADMYRDWHRQLEAGVDHLEAIIPLTVGRVPFHVRYTTEYDENGRPLKAYGSATLVVDDDHTRSAEEREAVLP